MIVHWGCQVGSPITAAAPPGRCPVRGGVAKKEPTTVRSAGAVTRVKTELEGRNVVGKEKTNKKKLRSVVKLKEVN